MEKEEVLKEYINAKYKSLRQFAIENGLKYPTIVAMLSRGIRNTNFDTVYKVCQALNIYVEPLVTEGIIVEIEPRRTVRTRHLEAYAALLRILTASEEYTLDGIPITPEEADKIAFGFEAMLEVIRRERAQNSTTDN